jgi:Flp pilus assembly protein TadD
LAESYLTAGDREAARPHYRKSLALEPGNLNAVEMLDRIDSDESD